TQSAALARVAHPRHSDYPVLVRQLESHHHAGSSPYRLLSINKEAASADIGHVSSYATRTAAGVRKFVLDLSRNRGTLEPAPLQLGGTPHKAPFREPGQP